MPNIYNALESQELEIFFNRVAEKILQNHLSLFLGAGSSIQYGAMNWDVLIEKVQHGNVNWTNTQKAQYIELKGMNIKKEIADILSNVSIDYKETKTFLNYLLSFDYKSLWTTNYDCIIENVLAQKAKSFIPIFKYQDFQKLSHPGGYFLYKINGSQADWKTIVITHEDFIDYRRSHEAYLILLKRELLCKSFLFLGCSFEDDILRICIKDILNCIGNNSENYSTDHFAIVVDDNIEKLNFICQDMNKHYNMNCLSVNNPSAAYTVAYGIASKVKYNSIFVSGAKSFERYSAAENHAKKVCQGLVNAFMRIEDFPFKFISGMGMSIGHFISGTVKQNCQNKNLNRYLQMEPFPFSGKNANKTHRENMISKAGIFIFLYGDAPKNNSPIEQNGMWEEYLLAKSDKDNIIIPIPCGNNSVSNIIFQNELNDKDSFSTKHKLLMEIFDCDLDNNYFFSQLVEEVILATRKRSDQIIEKIVTNLAK